MAGGPLAGYAVGGRRGTTGLAGIAGVLVTALVAGTRLLVRGPARRDPARDREALTRRGRGRTPIRCTCRAARPVHRLPAEVKIVAALLGAICVVATPREAFGHCSPGSWWCSPSCWASPDPARLDPRRAVIELPFVVLAVLLPFTGGPPRGSTCSGSPLSEPGLLGAWNIVVKGTLGVLISLHPGGATTPLRDLLLGMQRLRRRRLVVTIATLMLRYTDLIVAEAGRMRRARPVRGHDPRFLWQVAATARGIGALFIRAYERGERVHLAMLSRGFDGALPHAAEARRAAASGSRAWRRRAWPCCSRPRVWSIA